MQKIKMHQVQSSNIKAVGYDEQTRILRIEFLHGKSAYEYMDVEEQALEGLLTAESVGKYFGAHIKGLYEYRKVPAQQDA